jgi:transcriptional regulator with XRE-family HTH domain
MVANTGHDINRRKPLAQVAAEVGISLSYLHDLLHGRRGMRSLRKWAPKIAQVMGLTVEELLEEVEAARQRERAQKSEGQEPASPALRA